MPPQHGSGPQLAADAQQCDATDTEDGRHGWTASRRDSEHDSANELSSTSTVATPRFTCTSASRTPSCPAIEDHESDAPARKRRAVASSHTATCAARPSLSSSSASMASASTEGCAAQEANAEGVCQVASRKAPPAATGQRIPPIDPPGKLPFQYPPSGMIAMAMANMGATPTLLRPHRAKN